MQEGAQGQEEGGLRDITWMSQEQSSEGKVRKKNLKKKIQKYGVRYETGVYCFNKNMDQLIWPKKSKSPRDHCFSGEDFLGFFRFNYLFWSHSHDISSKAQKTPMTT